MSDQNKITWMLVQEESGPVREAGHAICYSRTPGFAPMKMGSIRGVLLAQQIVDYLNENQVEPYS